MTRHQQPRKPFTEVDDRMLRDHYFDTPTELLARVLERSRLSVYQRARKLGLSKSSELVAEMSREAMKRPDHGGRAAAFKPGHVPANKGKKMPPGWAPGRMRETQFACGNTSHTWQPIGSYTVDADGYLKVKVSDDRGKESRFNWAFVHRRVWERVHGPIPPGHVVRFKPGMKTADPEQLTVDRLELLTHAEHGQRNSIHRYPPEVKQAIRLVAKLRRKIDEQSQ